MRRGDLLVTVAATGKIEAKTRVEVGTELSGLISDVKVDFNARVHKGDVLAVFDASEYEAQVTQSQADLKAAAASEYQAAATLREAGNKLERTRDLQRRGWLTPYGVEPAEAAYERAIGELAGAKARVALAEAKLESSRTKLSKTEIRAPMDGTILDRLIEPGQVVVAALQTPHLFTIVGDLQEMTLTAAVSEADIAAVAPGQTVRFTVDAYPQREFTGSVVQIRNSPRKQDGVVTYDVVVAVHNADLLLKPGMTATSDILISDDKAVLMVPKAALRFSPPGQEPYRSEARPDGVRQGQVWVIDASGHVKPVAVTLGPSDGRMTEVHGAIAEGETVLTAVQTEPAA
jgi:HlyD family secretion protein